nr:hypothetical protein Iba_chr14dCG11250 [Ipomoea batatas]GME19617.1 hypothetical protein Iba_scaffold23341CG0010 [Ipomoea batatas]
MIYAKLQGLHNMHFQQYHLAFHLVLHNQKVQSQWPSEENAHPLMKIENSEALDHGEPLPEDDSMRQHLKFVP